MNTDAHNSGKAHSTHDITGSPTTHGSYNHIHNYTARVYTGIQHGYTRSQPQIIQHGYTTLYSHEIPHDTRSLGRGKITQPQILQPGNTTSYSHKNTTRY